MMLDRLIAAFERAAAWLLAAVMVLTFVSVALRYLFSAAIPDNFDIGRNLLGIAIFWGIALAGFRGEHITVDLLWSAAGPRLRRMIDVFAALVALFCMAVFTWAMTDKVFGTYADNVRTFDLHLPVWPFFAAAWIGILAAVPLLLLRAWRMVQGRLAATASIARE
jgi:TRAP-type transport system small permease protein